MDYKKENIFNPTFYLVVFVLIILVYATATFNCGVHVFIIFAGFLMMILHKQLIHDKTIIMT